MNSVNQTTNFLDKKLSGLGGWLILFGWFPLIIGGLISLLSLFFFINPDSSFQVVVAKQLLQSPNLYLSVIYVGLIGNIVLFLLSAWTFIKRKRKWVSIAIAWAMFSLVWGVLMTTVFVLSLPPDDGVSLGFNNYTSSFQSAVTAIILVAYLYKSKRVKNTFIN